MIQEEVGFTGPFLMIKDMQIMEVLGRERFTIHTQVMVNHVCDPQVIHMETPTIFLQNLGINCN